MANTVSLLSYANTFGDWIIQTNALAKENNDLSSNSYIKQSGTLFLNDSALGLQVANNAIISGQLQIQGVGSSGYIQNNLRVDQQVYFTNTTLGLTNAGQANIGGPLLALGSGVGLSVSNNATIGGNVNIALNETIGKNLTVSGNTALNGNNLVVRSNTVITNTVFISGSTMVANNLTVASSLNVGGSAEVLFDLTTKDFNSNTAAITSLIDANSASCYFGRVITSGELVVGGNFVIRGSTSLNSNTITLSSEVNNQTSSVDVYRNTTNASIRWNELQNYWDIKNTNDNNYYKILTTEFFSDDSSSNSSTTIATSAAVNNVNTYFSDAVTGLSYRLGLNNNIAASSYNRANTSANTFVAATNGVIVNPINGVININGNYGVTVQGASNNIVIGTPQDLRTTGTVVFNSLGLSSALNINSGGTNNNGVNSPYVPGQVLLYDGVKFNSKPNVSTTLTGTYGTDRTISNITYSAYGELTGITVSPIAITRTQVSGLSASASIDTTNANNITSGYITNSRLASSTISGVSLGGNLGSLTCSTTGTGISGSATYNGSGATTFNVISNATSASTPGTIVARDQYGNFNVGTITGALNGAATQSSSVYCTGSSDFRQGYTSATGWSVAQRDGSGNLTANFYYGTAQYANYADLAEKYTTNVVYPTGTVVVVNLEDDSEGTESTEISQIVLGVVSEKPAFLMNQYSSGQPLALRGRVPVRVIGPVKKGQTLVSAPNGMAMVGVENKFGISLENNLNEGEKMVEVVIL